MPETTKCSACGATSPSGATYCSRCRKKLPVYCRDCIYRRKGTRVDPFVGITSWTPDLLKAKQEFDHEGQELAYLEKDRFASGEDFDFEPLYYDWCETKTDKEERSFVDPVSGERTRIYVLCARANANRDCADFCLRQ